MAEVASVLEPEAVIELAAERAHELLGSDAAGLVLQDTSGIRVFWRYAPGTRDGDRVVGSARVLPNARLTRALFRRRRAVLVADTAAATADAHPLTPLVQEVALRSFIAAPLAGKKRALGVLLVGHHHPNRFDADDVLLASRLAGQTAVALENAEQFSRARIAAEHLQRLIESSGDAIITTDLKGRIASWNAGAQAIYGWTPREAIGEILPMVPPEQGDDARAMMARLLSHGETINNYETERLRKDGLRIPVVVTVSPIRNAQGEIVELLGISKDMSARRQVEEQQRRLSLLEDRERIAMELHDGAIQSLYAVGLGIEAVGQVLETDPMLARTRLLQARDSLNQVIDDIRGYITGLHPEALEAGGLVAGLTDLARSVESNTLATCEIEVAADAESILGREAVRDIYQIVHEALSNVVRHAGATRAGVDLSQNSDSWELRIWDNGQSFDPEGPHRAEAQGLRNMRARALRLGGTFCVSRGPGGSTDVVVTLPAPAAHQ
jgi:PAS domain S-box-containing protein